MIHNMYSISTYTGLKHIYIYHYSTNGFVPFLTIKLNKTSPKHIKPEMKPFFHSKLENNNLLFEKSLSDTTFFWLEQNHFSRTFVTSKHEKFIFNCYQWISYIKKLTISYFLRTTVTTQVQATFSMYSLHWVRWNVSFCKTSNCYYSF